MLRAVVASLKISSAGLKSFQSPSILLPVSRSISFTGISASSKNPLYAGMASSSSDYNSILYDVKGRVAHITLNRPERYNAIDLYMPWELERAVEAANLDESVKVILLSGTKVFCSGYDLKMFSEGERGDSKYDPKAAESKSKMAFLSQKMPWDPYVDFKYMSRCNKAWMSLFHSQKPVVCKIRGVAIGGGSDMALCCDVTFASDDARIGYPPSRVWGCPTTAMWAYRVGAERAKRILFTGEILSGAKAAEIGLIGQAVPEKDLDKTVDEFIQRMINVPTNQLFFQKQVINQVIEQMGLASTQRLATVFDGMTRHSPEGVAFQQRAHEVGFKKAVEERDSGIDAVWSNMDDPKSKL